MHDLNGLVLKNGAHGQDRNLAEVTPPRSEERQELREDFFRPDDAS
jgi:hypothetical protein